MQKLAAVFCLMLSLLTALVSSIANAYERDTHFDVTYHLSRAAGLNDGVSKLFALGNQYIDQGLISSPMLMSVQRQLFHFPGDIEKVEIEGHGSISLPSAIFNSKLSLAERNSAIGNYLLALGLKNGDLLLVALGLHIKMDTYGHAGHSNLIGHMEAGHNTDRAFLESAKYEDMIRSIIQTLVSVKQLMPEAGKDEVSALKYLNRFAKKSNLKRDLTLADLQKGNIVAGVLLKDYEFQSIFRENMFKKYEYKKIALQKIYGKFKKNGVIKSDVTFDELFPDDIISDPRLSTKDVIKYVIVTTTNANFLKTEGDKEIFNLKALYGFNSEEIFHEKFQIEVERFKFRLRELKNEEEQIKQFSLLHNIDLGQYNDLIEEYHEHNKELRAQKKAIEKRTVEEFLADRYQLTLSEMREIKYKLERVESEQNQLLAGVGLSSRFDLDSKEFINERAVELAESRNAEEIAIKLTINLIPAERTEYIKQNFEGNTENRQFEVEYKADAYRLHRLKVWGVNFYFGEGKNPYVMKIQEAVAKFKRFINKNATPNDSAKWAKLAQDTAAAYMQMSLQDASIYLAESISLNKILKRQAFRKLFAYVGPAFIPWFFGKLIGKSSGYNYIQDIIKRAKTFAKDHEAEDMKAKAAQGKYARDLMAAKQSREASLFVKKMNRVGSFAGLCEAIFN